MISFIKVIFDHLKIWNFHLKFQCNSFEETITNVCEHALEKLNGIFVHGDATVLQAAADACTQMLESQMAVSLLSMFNSVAHCMRP